MFNRRTIAILILGFSSGLPIVLIGSTLQAWYTKAGVSLMTIGALSLVGQPYLYKFIWAPFLDRFVPGRLGRRRSWILLMQLFIVGGLSGMAFLHPQTEPMLLASVALMVAVFSATQDIAFNAYTTDLLHAEERGVGAGMTNVGYRSAMLVAGAIALVLADQIGWRLTYLIMVVFMVGEMGFTLFGAPRLQSPPEAPKDLKKATLEPFRNFLKRDAAVLILVFIIIYKLCDAFALALNTPFLLRGVGFTLTEVGSITKVVGLVGALLGSIAGGSFYRPLGLYRSLMIFGFLQMLSGLPFALLAVVGKSYWLMAASVFGEYFCGALSSVAMVAFLMTLCDRRYTATQYALFSAVAATGRVFVGPGAAWLVDRFGWAEFYVLTFIIGLPSLAILWLLQHRGVFDRAEQQILMESTSA